MKNIIVLVFVFFHFITKAQQAGSVDLTFNTNDVGYGLWDGSNGRINVTAIQDDGKIVIGGAFTTYSNNWKEKLIRLNSDGSLDSSFNVTLPNEITEISSLTIQSDGRILVGGTRCFFRLNVDGSSDINFNLNSNFNPSSVSSGTIHAIIIEQNGKILVGGDMNPYIQRFNTDGTPDINFINTIFSGWISDLAIQQNGKIIICGNFSNYIARLNNDGSIDSSFNLGVGFKIGNTPDINTHTSKIKILSDDKILVCGSFNNYNGTPVIGIAKLNSDGSLDTNFNTQFNETNFSADIKSFIIQADNKIIISGSFQQTLWGPFPEKTIRLNSDGTPDTSFNVNDLYYEDDYMNRKYSVFTQTIQVNGKIIIAGAFSAYSEVGRNNIARLNEDGSLDMSFSTGIGTGAKKSVNISLLLPDGKIIIAGDFTWYNGVRRNKIARLNSDGDLDFSFNSGIGANLNITSICVQPDGKIIVGGNFDKYNNTPQKGLVRLNLDGSLDLSFNANPSGTSYFGIKTIILQPNGKILIGGDFENDVNFIQLNIDGSNDLNFIPNISGQSVMASAVQSDGKIIIGGNFSYTDYLKRLNPDGSVDLSFNTTNLPIGFVTSIAIQTNGKILASVTANSIYTYLFRFNIDGTLDSSFTVGISNNLIKSIIIQPNGKLIVSGYFTNFNNYIKNNIIRLNSDGSIDNNFNIGIGANNLIYTALLQLDGNIIIGGAFTSFDIFGRNRLARINGGESLSSNVVENYGNSKVFYPNPSSKKIYINKNIKSISIYSIDGKMMEVKLENNEINISDIPNGIYLIQVIDNDDKIYKEKLIKI